MTETWFCLVDLTAPGSVAAVRGLRLAPSVCALDDATTRDEESHLDRPHSLDALAGDAVSEPRNQFFFHNFLVVPGRPSKVPPLVDEEYRVHYPVAHVYPVCRGADGWSCKTNPSQILRVCVRDPARSRSRHI